MFIFVPVPQILPYNPLKYREFFQENKIWQSYTLLSSDVEVDLGDLRGSWSGKMGLGLA